MNASYIIILDDEEALTFEGENTPFQLILSKEQGFYLSTLDVSGSYLFLAVNFKGGFIIVACLLIESILQYDDRYGPGGYILEANKIRSFRICRPSEANQMPAIQLTLATDSKISKLDGQKLVEIIEYIFANSYTSFLGAGKTTKDIVCAGIFFDKSHKSLAKEIVHSVLRIVPLVNARKLPKDKSLSAFVSVACQCAAHHLTGQKSVLVIGEICKIDPLAGLRIGQTMSLNREVDTLFTAVDPANIRPRLFLGDFNNKNSEDVLRKTQLAEFRHQAIVRDLANRFLSIGLYPLESRSVDLAVRIGKSLFIFEVKSANELNYQIQMESGIVQILRYSTVINSEEIDPCNAVLIMEKCPQADIYEQGNQMLSRLGYCLMIYNDSVPWPERISGLEDLLTL